MSTPFDHLRSAVAGLLPAEVGEELKNNIDATLRSHFEQMNLATRDQLEVQEKVLRRTRERLAELEQQVAALEATLASTSKQD